MASERANCAGLILVTFYHGVNALVNKGRITDIIHLDFSKRFDIVPHKNLSASIKRSMARRLSKVIQPLYPILVRLHLEYCIQLWCPHHKKGMDLLEWVQRRAMKLIRSPLL